MNQGREEEALPLVASWMHPGFWEDVEREIARVDASELALFEAAGRMAESAREGYRMALFDQLVARLPQ